MCTRLISGIKYTYGVVSNIAGRSAQVNDGPGGWTARCIRMHVGHDVVPGKFLFVGGRPKVHIVDVLPQFFQLFLGYVQAQIL